MRSNISVSFNSQGPLVYIEGSDKFSVFCVK